MATDVIDWAKHERDLALVVELLDEIEGILHEECFENYITDMKDIDRLAGYKQRSLSVSGVVVKLREIITKARDGEITSPKH